MKPFAPLALIAAIWLSGCEDPYTPPTFTSDGDLIFLSGDIDDTALDALKEVIADNPQAKTLVLTYVGGSVDDEANLELAQEVRRLGLATVVPTGGLIASGGTDLFLAGTKRTLGQGACVGVHAWATDGYTARDIPGDDPEHQGYIDYFTFVGIDPEFYWYTLEAAPAEEMHWMSATEARQFDMATTPIPTLGSEPACQER